MDFSKIKDSKILKIALIIALPTALVAAYYGYKYIKKKNIFNKDKETNTDLLDEVDTTGFEKYSIIVPFQSDVVTKIYEKIVDVKYSPLDSEVITDANEKLIAVVNILTLPNNINTIRTKIKTVSPEAEIKKINEGK